MHLTAAHKAYSSAASVDPSAWEPSMRLGMVLRKMGSTQAAIDALETALVTETAQPAHDTLLPLGSRRQVARLAGKTLQPEAKVIDLPDAAPYGAVLVDTDACTLCLSCVSLCPSGALGDNPDLPQLRFQEDACVTLR